MALIEDSHSYNPARGPLVAYLMGMARHHVLRSLKRERPYVSIEAGSSNGKAQASLSPEDPHSLLSRRESIHSVQQAILSLPEHYREAVVLCDLNELNYEDAASVLRCSVGTVRSRLHRGRALLTQKLMGGKKVEADGRVIDSGRCLV